MASMKTYLCNPNPAFGTRKAFPLFVHPVASFPSFLPLHSRNYLSVLPLLHVLVYRDVSVHPIASVVATIRIYFTTKTRDNLHQPTCALLPLRETDVQDVTCEGKDDQSQTSYKRL